jgi:hypothetical protein
VSSIALAIAAVALAASCASVGAAFKSAATPTPKLAEVVACEHAGYDGAVVGAFTIRVGDLAKQDERQRGVNGPRPLGSFYESYPADTPIVLCFFDGSIAAPGGPPPIPPATFRPYDRYVVTVDPSGASRFVAAGHRDTITIAPEIP